VHNFFARQQRIISLFFITDIVLNLHIAGGLRFLFFLFR
jgi:hypothetical protein